MKFRLSARGLLAAGLLIVLTGCSQTAQTTGVESPSLGPAPGRECLKIWIEDTELPDHGDSYDGCYQVEDGHWTHQASYTDCLEDPSDPESVATARTRLWEYEHPETGVLLYAFTDDGETAWIDNGDIIGTLSGVPAIETARSVCTDEY